MARYIDAEAFEKEFCEDCKFKFECTDCPNCATLAWVKEAPTADVAPVLHGRWVWKKDHYYCSVCGCNRFHDLHLGLDAAYCGRCGTKMDGE